MSIYSLQFGLELRLEDPLDISMYIGSSCQDVFGAEDEDDDEVWDLYDSCFSSP